MINTKLTFAVYPVDAFTPEKPVMGECTVNLAGGTVKPHKNRTGFYCFTDLLAGRYFVVIKNKYYLDAITEVETVDLEEETPAVDIKLEPNPYYPFPKGTTLLTGKVVDENKEPLTEALVRIPGGREIRTDRRGQFLFYFTGFTDVERNMRIRITKVGYRTKRPTCRVVKGERSYKLIELEK